LGDLDVDSRIVLKWITDKGRVRVWTGVIWLRIHSHFLQVASILFNSSSLLHLESKLPQLVSVSSGQINSNNQHVSGKISNWISTKWPGNVNCVLLSLDRFQWCL
jgi:hypothetical protein